MHDPSEYTTALRTTDLALLAVVKSLLDSAAIPYVVQGEEALHMFPIGGGFFNPKAVEASLMVRQEDMEDVSQLLSSLETDTKPDSPS
jgi:hypothetical protein